nr:hypothetical protein [Tanacetum cinerariifolium]
MLNKENYVPWSSRLLWYAKSRPNGKLIHNSIINGPYVRRMIHELGDTNQEVLVNETFHVQTDDELTEKELNQIEADEQAIQNILLDLPEDIYAAVDSCETAQEIWLRVQQMMKGSDIGIQEKKAKLFNEWKRFTSNDGESIESYYHQWSRHVTIVHQTKDLHTADYTQLYDFLKYNQKEVDELKAERLAKTQDPLALMATSNNPYNFSVLNQDQPSFNQNYMQQPMPNPEDITDPTTAMNMALTLMAKAFKQNYSTPTNNNQRISSNPRNRQIAQPGMNMGQDRQMQMVGANQNLNGNGNLVVERAEGNAAGHNDLDEIEEVNANCILMANLQQASTSGTQTDKAPIYDSDGSAENNNNVIPEVTSVEQSGETVKQHPANVEETRALIRQAGERVITLAAIYEQCTYSREFELKEKRSNLQTELERTKERFENCIIKKENEYAKLWNDWYKKCDECKYDKISYDKAYKDMQHKIERLQAQLGDLKGKGKDTLCVSDTLIPLSQKLENENVELEFLVLNYAKENAHLKTIYKNLFDSIYVSRTQTKTIIASMQHELQNTIYENTKLRAQLFKKVYVRKNNTRGTSTNTKFAKQSILGKPPMLGEIHALSKPVTSNLIPTPQESKVVKNDKVIAPGMFRINPFKTSREEKNVPNSVRASDRTTPIIVSQPTIFTKKVENYDSNGLSSTGVDNTKTRRPSPRSNTKNDRVPSASKGSRSKNKEV